MPMFAKDSKLKIEGNEVDGATLQVCVLHYLPGCIAILMPIHNIMKTITTQMFDVENRADCIAFFFLMNNNRWAGTI